MDLDDGWTAVPPKFTGHGAGSGKENEDGAVNGGGDAGEGGRDGDDEEGRGNNRDERGSDDETENEEEEGEDEDGMQDELLTLALINEAILTGFIHYRPDPTFDFNAIDLDAPDIVKDGVQDELLTPALINEAVLAGFIHYRPDPTVNFNAIDLDAPVISDMVHCIGDLQQILGGTELA